MLLGKAAKKVKIDKRFQKMLYSKEFQVTGDIDSHGEKIVKEKPEINEEVAQYYYLDDKEKEPEDKEEIEENQSLSESDSSEDNEPSEEDIWTDPQENIPLSEEISKRLAVQNFDWEQISLKDLYALFSSLCKKAEDQSIEKLELYVSQYGKSRMEKDAH